MLRKLTLSKSLILFLIGLNLCVTWVIYRYLYGDLTYLAQDAWQFNESAFKKTRGAPRYLTILAHPYLHNLNPFIGVLIDAVSFVVLLMALTSATNKKRLTWAVIGATALTLPIWPVTINWFPWPAQMSLINFATAGYFYWVLNRSGSLKTDLVISVVFIFFCLGYYEIYCLFAAFLPLYKSYDFKSYLIFMGTVLAAIFLAYGLSLIYQMQFWGDIKKISGYRVLAQTDGLPFFEKNQVQYFAVFKSLQVKFIPNGISGVIFTLAWFILFFIAISTHVKYWHVVIIIGMFVSMYAVMNHIIMPRNMAPLFFMPVAVFLVMSAELPSKQKIAAGVAVAIISLGFIQKSRDFAIPNMKEKQEVTAQMLSEITNNMSDLSTEKRVFFIGVRPRVIWSEQNLNTLRYNLNLNFKISFCGRQNQVGRCVRDIERDPGLKTWLCSNPTEFSRYETNQHIYISIGRHRALNCN